MPTASTNTSELIVIGGSSGAIDALLSLLPVLPSGYSVPVVVALHVQPNKPSLLVEVLRDKCKLVVKEAEDKEELVPGIYVAPPGYHLLIERRGCFSLSVDAPVNFSRPSIDVLFESAADAFSKGAIGVLLSGGNDDGVRGLQAIKAAGGRVLVQDPENAQIPTMPRAALEKGLVERGLTASELGAVLLEWEKS